MFSVWRAWIRSFSVTWLSYLILPYLESLLDGGKEVDVEMNAYVCILSSKLKTKS
jgi:hypothetical protein